MSDETLVRSLDRYVGMAERVLSEPERWLALDDDEAVERVDPGHRALQALRDRTVGTRSPSDPDWEQQPLQQREEWWVDRISLGAGLAAAAPRLAGALADRLPLQAALGAAASGLTVCAVARERGVTAPADWVPLLARVLFDREVMNAPTSGLAAEEAERALLYVDEADADTPDAGPLDADPLDADPLDADPHSRLPDRTDLSAQHSARTLWRLAAALRDLQHALDERPRGGRLARTLAKVPVVGVAGGWLDERGAIKRAAAKTAQLLS